MKTRRLTLLLGSLLVWLSVVATAQPSLLGPSDQKAGSVLVFPLVAFNATRTADTRITVSNISSKKSVAYTVIHLSADDCLESNIPLEELTPNGSKTYGWEDFYLGGSGRGYLLVIAVDKVTGDPVQNNVLIGSAQVKLPVGYLDTTAGSVNDGYNAQTFWAYKNPAAGTRTLNFDGLTYDKVPNAFVTQLQKPMSVPGQTIVTVGLNGSISGSLSGAATVGTALAYGYDANKNVLVSRSRNGLITGTCFGWLPLPLIGANPSIQSTLNALNTAFAGGYGTLEFNIGAGVGLVITPKGGMWSGIQPLHFTSLTDATLVIP